MSALAAPVPPVAAGVTERMTPKAVWTLVITSIAVFMVTLDNLVVTTAIPVTLTVLSAAVPAARRGMALGIWGGISGLAVALGPLVGGAIVSGISWHWIFWLNVPIGLALLPFILTRLEETHGPSSKLDLPGLALGSTGLVGIVWALVSANNDGWTSPQIISAFILGCALLACFVAWELRVE